MQQQNPAAQLQQQRGKHTVRMVLLKDHEHLGSKGDIVEVKPGFARHHLFPSGEADYAVPSVLKQLRDRGVVVGLSSAQGKAAGGPVDRSSLPLEQQLPHIIQLLNSKPLVVSRKGSLKQAEQPMVGVVNAKQLSLYVAKQLHVELAPELILMDPAAPITQFGSFKVPLNLRDEAGRQVELSVQVNRTYRAPGLRRLKLWAQQEGLLPQPTPKQRQTSQQQPGSSAEQQQQQPQPSAQQTA